jgi:hypothetical protein
MGLVDLFLDPAEDHGLIWIRLIPILARPTKPIDRGPFQ